jgi:hypothetical protein
MPQPPALSSPTALRDALGDDMFSAQVLTERLGCSQATLSREVRKAAGQVLAIGKAQRTRYVRARASGVEQPLLVTQVDAQGKLHSLGQLYTVGMATGSRTVFEGFRSVALFEGLPWFVSDMRPAGYLGRQYPARMLSLLQGQTPGVYLPLPPSINDWTDDHVLRALAFCGHDEPGDLILGRQALQMHLDQAPPEIITRRRKLKRYPQLAEQSLGQGSGMSSAAGEQPKFTALVETAYESAHGSSPEPAHVIVKFSPAGKDAAAQRWRDLLRCECHALQTIAAHAHTTGAQAAQAALVEDAAPQGRVYLEVQRFDRVGMGGRVGVISLGAADDHFVGQRISWAQTAQQLAMQKRLSAQDMNRIALLQAFGMLIHNSDMHLGNLALLHEGPATQRFRLAPIYDMLPMRLRPVGSEVIATELPAVKPVADVLAVWSQAQAMAAQFYARVQDDKAISPAFRKLLATALPQ